MKNEFDGSVEELLGGDFDREQTKKDEMEKERREEILSLTDPAQMGAEEYEVFVNYARANLYTVMRTKIKMKVPDREKVDEMAQDAISKAIMTYDKEKAAQSGAAFRTHLGWQIRAIVTDYVRALKKSYANELDATDEEKKEWLESSLVQSDSQGNQTTFEEYSIPEYQNTDKKELEGLRKLETAMRHVRYELPRENNLIIDVAIGEIKKSDDKPYSLTEWAQMTNQKDSVVKRIFKSSKKLIMQKLYRKGYMEILNDEEKTTEDLMKDTTIAEQIKAQEKDEAIIESADITTIIKESDDTDDALAALDQLLKG